MAKSKGVGVDETIRDIKNGLVKPLYFIGGEEPYFVDALINHISDNLLDEAEMDFNKTTFYGKDANFNDILSAAKRFPMMSQYNLVVVKEAQFLKGFEELESYFANPAPDTVLAIGFKGKKPNGTKKWVKTLKKNAVYIESNKLYDNQIPALIEKFAKNKKLNIEPTAVRVLADNMGTDLSQLSNSIDKLSSLLGDGATITTKDIEKNIGISREFNVFEFINAVGAKDKMKVHRIADYFGKNPKAGNPIMVITLLNSFFSKVMVYHSLKDKSSSNVASTLKINPYFVKDYQTGARNYSQQSLVHVFNYLRKYDLMSKGKGAGMIKEDGILKELCFILMNI